MLDREFWDWLFCVFLVFIFKLKLIWFVLVGVDLLFFKICLKFYCLGDSEYEFVYWVELVGELNGYLWDSLLVFCVDGFVGGLVDLFFGSLGEDDDFKSCF